LSVADSIVYQTSCSSPLTDGGYNVEDDTSCFGASPRGGALSTGKLTGS
jgi:hypothetical protein